MSIDSALESSEDMLEEVGVFAALHEGEVQHVVLHTDALPQDPSCEKTAELRHGECRVEVVDASDGDVSYRTISPSKVTSLKKLSASASL